MNLKRKRLEVLTGRVFELVDEVLDGVESLLLEGQLVLLVTTLLVDEPFQDGEETVKVLLAEFAGVALRA